MQSGRVAPPWPPLSSFAICSRVARNPSQGVHYSTVVDVDDVVDDGDDEDVSERASKRRRDTMQLSSANARQKGSLDQK